MGSTRARSASPSTTPAIDAARGCAYKVSLSALKALAAVSASGGTLVRLVALR